MFSLYYLRTDGKPNGAVKHGDIELFGGLDSVDYSCQHATTARRAAFEAAARAECDVGIYRLVGKTLRPAYRVQPSGRVLPPVGVEVPERERCVRDEGKPCFCTPCRAERREARGARA